LDINVVYLEDGGSKVQEYIRRRVLEISAYLIETSATVRQAATVFGVSKSTVHKDVTERLPRINQQLARKVRLVLDLNKAERHLRGGEATRRKYSNT
jgi:putative DeoR family transcriptional regulator (stage III sporulation protein D)